MFGVAGYNRPGEERAFQATDADRNAHSRCGWSPVGCALVTRHYTSQRTAKRTVYTPAVSRPARRKKIVPQEAQVATQEAQVLLATQEAVTFPLNTA